MSNYESEEHGFSPEEWNDQPPPRKTGNRIVTIAAGAVAAVVAFMVVGALFAKNNSDEAAYISGKKTYEHASSQGDYRATFPKKPELQTQSQAGLTIYVEMAELEDSAIGVGWVDVAPNLVDLEGAAQGFAGSLEDSEVLGKRTVKVDDFTAEEFTIKGKEEGQTAYVTAVAFHDEENRLYVIISAGKSEEITRKGAGVLTKSFELV